MRVRNWYFQGWERRTGEDGKSRLVYTGEYYRFSGGPGPVRRTAGLLTAALVVLYLATALLPSPGGMWRPAAIPLLLELLPLIYLVIGAVCLMRVREPFTFRDRYASWRRMEVSALWSTVFTAAMAVMELVYLFLYGEGALLGRELIYLAGELGCAALSVILFLYLRRHPCLPSVENTEME